MLGDLVDTCVLVYLNAILIYLAMAGDYTRNIKAVFERLTKSNLYLKCKNCFLFLQEVEFLRHVVSECKCWYSQGRHLLYKIVLCHYHFII